MDAKFYVVFAITLMNGAVYMDDAMGKLNDNSTLSNSTPQLNVLFLISDDLRPELGCYDGEDAPSQVHPKMHTPNLDKLAGKSLLLKKAYVQQALCSPSRTSFLTGRRPDTTHVYTIGPYFRNITGNFTTLPEYFKQQGYITAGLGKVFHPGQASGCDDPPSWTEPYYHAPNYEIWQEEKSQASQSWISVPTTVQTKEPLPDQQIATEASEGLETYARQNKPFFMAVGFHKPHLPFVFPSEFIRYYPSESVQLPLNPYAPIKMPEIAWHNYITEGLLGKCDDIEPSNYTGSMNTSMADNTVVNLRRAYYSSVSYIDSLVGQVMDKLDELGLANQTIITFLGDHGWQLGEHGEWCKQTNFELATRIPMMVHVPGKTDQGIMTDKLVEAVDLYPTIVEAAGLPPLPLCPMNRSTRTMLCREGNSLMPIITNQSDAWKTAVFSQFPRKLPDTEMNSTLYSNYYDTTDEDWDLEGNGKAMGYSIRTKHFRYVYTEGVQKFCN